MFDVIVVGGGAAGLMAAGRAAELGKKVLLLEKKERVGKKILISGKGRCNITNNTDIQGIIDNTPGNGHFLYSTLYTFSNQDIVDFFKSRGVETKVERGGRIFPVSDRAQDVVRALEIYCKESGVQIKLNSEVKDVLADMSYIRGVVLSSSEKIECKSIILACGGSSYPGTGSTGDGYRISKKLGHTVTALKPSLVPLESENQWVKEMQGLSLRNVSVKFYDNSGKQVYNDFGEMLFTHFGVSGPVILSGSRHLLDFDYKGYIKIDLKPALDASKLDERIQRDFLSNSRKQYKNSLDQLLPQKMIPVVIKLSKIPEDKPVNQITKEERKRLVELLKNFKVNINGARPIKEAIVTAGGVSTDEINPSTMESKLIDGLFFAGEVIDVDAYTGGFNLTIAFSTGYLAGSNA